MALRQLSLRAAALFLTAASIVACSKKEDAVTPTPVVQQGVAFTVNGAVATVPVFSARPSGSNITVSAATGTGATSNSLALQMPKRVGSYNLATDSVATAYYTEGSSAIFSADTGTITVTSVSATNIVGTFNFVATPFFGTGTRTITNGTFNTNY